MGRVVLALLTLLALVPPSGCGSGEATSTEARRDLAYEVSHLQEHALPGHLDLVETWRATQPVESTAHCADGESRWRAGASYRTREQVADPAAAPARVVSYLSAAGWVPSAPTGVGEEVVKVTGTRSGRAGLTIEATLTRTSSGYAYVFSATTRCHPR